MTSSGISIIASIGAVNWFIFEAIWTKSKVKSGFSVYSAPKGLKVLFFIGVPLFTYGALVNLTDHPSEKWVSVILFGFSMLGLYFYPATILLSREKVVSIRWFGLKKVEMRWSEVDAIYSSPEDRSIIIQDKNQNRVAHTLLNIDREGFISQVREASAARSDKITVQL